MADHRAETRGRRRSVRRGAQAEAEALRGRVHRQHGEAVRDRAVIEVDIAVR